MASSRARGRTRAGGPPQRLCALGLAALAAAWLSGCYKYVPVEFTAVESGHLVRADLSPAGQESVVPRFGPGVLELRGMTLRTHADSLAVLVEAASGRQGMIATEAQPVRLSPPDVAQLYERRLSRGRTLLFGAGILAAAFLLVDSFADLGRVFDSDDVDPPVPPQLRQGPDLLRSGAFGPVRAGHDR